MTFRSGGENESPTTQVEVDLRGHSPGSLKIYPEGVASSIAKIFGAQDIRVGDREFDALYVVKATPESLAHRLFSPERRARVIATVRRTLRGSGGCFDLRRDSLRVAVAVFVDSESSALELAKAAEEFTAVVLELAPTAGIYWLNEASAAGGQCQVCGTEMRDGVVSCVRCKTPHHEQCWTYAGGCSTYACQEKRYVRHARAD
jgi:hypothetical protein